MSFENIPLAVRLLNGAKTLGILWRSGQRCGSGWSNECSCNPRTRFCNAKFQWTELARQDGRDLESGQYMIPEAMAMSELEAANIVMAVDLPGLGQAKIGQGGEIPVKDFLNLAKDPTGIESVFKILKVFPGSKVIETGKAAEVIVK
jgi:hypothetical protein